MKQNQTPNLGSYKRPDGVLLFKHEHKYYLIVMELKYKKTLEQAFRQIEEKRYVDRGLAYVKRRSGITVDPGCVYIAAGNMDQQNQVHY